MENASELTKELKYPDCMLGVAQTELSSLIAYECALVVELSSSASASGKSIYTVHRPTPHPLLTTYSTSSLTLNLRSKCYPNGCHVRIVDTCQSISQGQSAQ